ncbi:MAG: group II intron reverse transcriptase/maturase [Spartobacteria bacterium]|nr:group II intron reverse transcriptase/maturase [Spartobacteria bacterium]
MISEIMRIREKARKEKNAVFSSLYHHITDVDNLRECYYDLDGNKAVGVDGTTKQEYGEDLEANLLDLSERLKRGGFRPQPSLRKYIPKAGSPKGRPLGISAFECKIVELSIKRTLEGIYEEAFEDSSYGFREGRSPHQCIDALGRTIQQKKISYVVEADIRSFFDRVNHEWLMKFLEHRISDCRVLKLIKRLLNAGIMEDGIVRASEEGTPQGSILSPLLSNIYLHYVLDLWFRLKVKKTARGEAYYFRFADDFVACFQYKAEAEEFMRLLETRLEGFNLELATEKTRNVPFGRFARENASSKGLKADTFTFLGFQHYCGCTQAGYFKVKRRTCPKKLRQKLEAFAIWAHKALSVMTKGCMLRAARRKVVGHINYYGITDNSDQVRAYLYWAGEILFKWINRKSQRRSYTRAGFRQALQYCGWPTVTVKKNLSPFNKEAYQ